MKTKQKRTTEGIGNIKILLISILITTIVGLFAQLVKKPIDLGDIFFLQVFGILLIYNQNRRNHE